MFHDFRNYIQRQIRLSLFIVTATVFSALLLLSCKSDKFDGKLQLAKNGKTNYVIKVSNDDIVANTAATELARYLKSATGAEFTIEKNLKPSANPVIAVGPEAAKVFSPESDTSFEKLGNDGIVLKTTGHNLILTGAEGGKRGTLYAVYEFLENTVGCRWWTPTETYIPKMESLEVPMMNKKYVPKLSYREVHYKNINRNYLFAVHSRCNGNFEKIPEEYGGNVKFLGWCHTFYQLLPPEKYFEKHPEWYSEINGKRVAGNQESQLCLTNIEMRKELTSNALAWLTKNPEAGIISISQADWNEVAGCPECRCPQCLKLTEEEGASGPLIKFVNEVAEDIEKEFPDVYVETLAYQYTQKVPRTIRPRHNVIIRLCTINAVFSESLANGPLNETFRKDIEAWKGVAPQLFIWDYVVNFANYIQPHPNLKVLAPNIRFFIKNNARGLFEQGDNFSNCGDFEELKTWLIAQLMWNPSLDESKLVKDFLTGYYGAAAKPISAYLDLVDRAVTDSKIPLPCKIPDSPWMTYSVLNQATSLFNEAEKKVKDDPVLSRRVRKARLSLDYTWCNQYKIARLASSLNNELFMGPADIKSFCDDFIKTARSFSIGRFSEGRDFKNIEGILRKAVTASPYNIPDRCKGLSPDRWLDIQEYEFKLHGKNSAVLVDDPMASNGKAVRITGSCKEWPVRYPLYSDFNGLHCYVSIRCDIKPESDKKRTAFNLGIYDKIAPKMQNKPMAVQVSDVLQQYHIYDLGICRNITDARVWIAPADNPDVVAIYVDRIFFMKDNDRKQRMSAK